MKALYPADIVSLYLAFEAAETARLMELELERVTGGAIQSDVLKALVEYLIIGF